MLNRIVPQLAGLAVAAAGSLTLLTAPASAAVADSPTYTGHIELVTAAGQILGCVASSALPAGHTSNAATALEVTIAAGSQQNLAIVGGSPASPDLGLSDASSTSRMGGGTSWAFVTGTATTPAGSPSVNSMQSAVWSLDPSTHVLTPSWVYTDHTSATVEAWTQSSSTALVGVSNSVSRMIAAHVGDVVPVTLLLGDTCSGSATQSQAITFTSTPATTTYPGQAYTVTAAGGGSGNAVTFSSATPQICSVDAATGAVSFVEPGTCTIGADQAAASGYDAAPTATQDITVSQIPSHVAVGIDPTAPVTGQPTTATATVTVDAGTVSAAGGSVQFALDGTDVGSPVEVAADGTATSTAVPAPVGSHSLTATYTPDDTTDYAATQGSAPVTVLQATTTTAVTVHPTSLVATVSPVAPGAGTPTGPVTFSVAGVTVGSADLSDGHATLAYRPSSSDVGEIAAVYAGDDSFLGSSDSTSRSKPTLTAHVTSGRPAVHGWYRGPATVRFTCHADGSTLVGSCPAPVRVTHQGATSVTRTIRTADGGVATTSATVRVDTSAPSVRITGVRAGGSYFAAAPRARCVGSDKVSGVVSCTVGTARHGSRVVVTATAKDNAGNAATGRASYTVLDYAILGATLRDGVWQIHHGTTYTVVALGGRPRYVDASIAPTRPHRLDNAFHPAGTVAGRPRWAIGVTMSMSTRVSRDWEVGIKQGGRIHVLRVRVNG